MEELSRLFSFVCGQAPEHIWAPEGLWLPMCQRCTGLYVGAAMAVLLHLWQRPRLTRAFLGIHGAFLLLMIPFGYHWLPQGPTSRAVTGVLFGFGVVTFLLLPLADARERSRKHRKHNHAASESGRYFAGLLIALAAVP